MAEIDWTKIQKIEELIDYLYQFRVVALCEEIAVALDTVT